MKALLPSLADIESRGLRHAIFWTGAAFCAAGAAAVYHWNPENTAFFPTCPIRSLTGYYCPGCGMTRALHQLLHGHIGAALSFNPLLIVAAPFVTCWIISELFLLLSGRAGPRIQVSEKFMWLILIGVVTFGIVRNIPYYPLTLLAPH